MKIAPAISGYIGITGHTIKVKIPKRLNSPGILTDFSLAILVPFLGKDLLSHSLSTLSSCKIICPPNLQRMWLYKKAHTHIHTHTIKMRACLVLYTYI
jgi:hypothetical protein